MLACSQTHPADPCLLTAHPGLDPGRLHRGFQGHSSEVTAPLLDISHHHCGQDLSLAWSERTTLDCSVVHCHSLSIGPHVGIQSGEERGGKEMGPIGKQLGHWGHRPGKELMPVLMSGVLQKQGRSVSSPSLASDLSWDLSLSHTPAMMPPMMVQCS